MREEIEAEKEVTRYHYYPVFTRKLERERIKQQLFNEEKIKISEQQKVEEQKLREKLENEEIEYRKKRGNSEVFRGLINYRIGRRKVSQEKSRRRRKTKKSKFSLFSHFSFFQDLGR
jgi:hypothetical protein